MQVKSVIAGILCAVALSACEPIVNQRGHVSDDKIAERVFVGTTSKTEVMQMFGSPSSVSMFGDETWYYIQAQKEAKAFLAPEITEQKVTQIVFDASGVAKSVNGYGLDDKQDVAIVDKITPTEGHSLGFLEQTLGNLGRFNAPDEMKTPGRPGGF